VPGRAAPVTLDFIDVAGSACGALLPTGNACDVVDGVEASCIDNGMPVVILRAADFGKTGSETPEALESDRELASRIEAVRLAVGPRMGLGDVSGKTVPKMCLVAAAGRGGAIATRTFIPHRVHESIGVLGAATVAAACLLPGSVAQRITGLEAVPGIHRLDVEHPTGFLTVELELDVDRGDLRFLRTALLRTARKLMEGCVFVPEAAWRGT
jgi:4-oxalomesaconate tautomerase